MKRNDLFWKIIVIVFLLWLFLFLWSNSIYIEITAGQCVIKINKFTGKLYYSYIGDEKGWQRNN